MSILKRVIKYDNANAIEATWVNIEPLPDLEVPAIPALYDADGNKVQAEVPAHTLTGRVQETAVRCHAYSGVQMQMFRDDVAQYGGDISQYEALIAEVKSENESN